MDHMPHSRKKKKFSRSLGILIPVLIVLVAGFLVLDVTVLVRNRKTLQASAAETVTETTETETARQETVAETAAAAQQAVQTQAAKTEAVKATERAAATTRSAEDQADEEAEKILASMSAEEKVAQLFFVMPEQLTGQKGVTAAGPATESALKQYPVGGIVYFENNVVSPEQLSAMTGNTMAFSRKYEKIPLFIGMDEEGGKVTRIASNAAFGISLPDATTAETGASGDPEKAHALGRTIGSYLKKYGINIDFAPDADVLSNPENKVIGTRSFGSDPELVWSMASAMARGLEEEGIVPAYKHFPGHGATKGDTHAGFAYTDKTVDELMKDELVPFRKAAENNEPVIMVSHISLTALGKDSLPASLSPDIVDGILRKKLGYDGLVITDAMVMGAVTRLYSSGEAAVRAVEAGIDMILMPADFHTAYAGVLDAVNSGRISSERLDRSVRRILRVKCSRGIR